MRVANACMLLLVASTKHGSRSQQHGALSPTCSTGDQNSSSDVWTWVEGSGTWCIAGASQDDRVCGERQTWRAYQFTPWTVTGAKTDNHGQSTTAHVWRRSSPLWLSWQQCEMKTKLNIVSVHAIPRKSKFCYFAIFTSKCIKISHCINT